MVNRGKKGFHQICSTMKWSNYREKNTVLEQCDRCKGHSKPRKYNWNQYLNLARHKIVFNLLFASLQEWNFVRHFGYNDSFFCSSPTSSFIPQLVECFMRFFPFSFSLSLLWPLSNGIYTSHRVSQTQIDPFSSAWIVYFSIWTCRKYGKCTLQQTITSYAMEIREIWIMEY